MFLDEVHVNDAAAAADDDNDDGDGGDDQTLFIRFHV